MRMREYCLYYRQTAERKTVLRAPQMPVQTRYC